MSKDYRGIIARAELAQNNSIYGVLVSEDLLAHEAGYGKPRNTLTEGGSIRTSTIQEFYVEDGQVFFETLNSTYLIEGGLTVIMSMIKVTANAEAPVERIVALGNMALKNNLEYIASLPEPTEAELKEQEENLALLASCML